MHFSVVIPCHNAAATIKEALESVVAQTRAAHEVVVVDDGSSDDSRAQIEAMRAQLEAGGVALRVLDSSWRNAAGTRNIGIEAASGDWIAFLDADDFWYPGHLERAARLLEGSKAVAFMANHHFLSERGVEPIPPEMRARLDAPRADLTHLDYADLARQGFHFGHSTVLFRRARVLEVGGFDVEQVRRHDMDLWLRVLQGETWAYHPEAAAKYRVDTPGSISKSVISCEQFFLRALLKNRDGYPGAAMDELIGKSARKAMSLAFVDGSRADYRASRQLAWPHLTPKFRLFYASAVLARPLFQGAIRLKRAWVWRGKNRG